MTRAVWFGMWHCHCSTITATEAEIADRCPVHGAGLMTGFGAGREIVHDPDPAVFRYGFDPAGDCCPEHRRPVQPSLFDTDDGSSVTGVA